MGVHAMTAETSANQNTEITQAPSALPAENTAEPTPTAPVPKKPARKRVRKPKPVATETQEQAAADTPSQAPAVTTEAAEIPAKPAPKKRVRKSKKAAKPAETAAKIDIQETADSDAPAAEPAPVKKAATTRKAKPRAKKAVKAKVAVKPLVAQPVIARPIGKVAVAVTARATDTVIRKRPKKVAYHVDDVTGRPILPEGYKPAANEEYMNALHQEYFRQRLQQWRADLVEESRLTIENLRDEVRDIGDEAERATRETENSLELRTRDRYRKLIAKIDSTLKRLDEGDYGYCVDTGEEIGLGRLEVRLTAERTVDAQERWEHLQKQHGE